MRLPRIRPRLTPRQTLAAILALMVVGVGASTAILVRSRRHTRSVVARGASAQTSVQPPGEKPVLQIEQPVLEQYAETGKPAWRIKLEQISLRTGGGSVEAQQLKEGIIYDTAGAAAIRVSAEKAHLNVVSKDFLVSGRCRAVTREGAIMTTEKVQWINAERRLFFPEEVVLTHRDITVSTRGMSYFPDRKTVHAPGQVSARTKSNAVVGRNLRYNLETQDFELDTPAIVVRDVKEAEQKLKELE